MKVNASPRKAVIHEGKQNRATVVAEYIVNQSITINFVILVYISLVRLTFEYIDSNSLVYNDSLLLENKKIENVIKNKKQLITDKTTNTTITSPRVDACAWTHGRMNAWAQGRRDAGTQGAGTQGRRVDHVYG